MVTSEELAAQLGNAAKQWDITTTEAESAIASISSELDIIEYVDAVTQSDYGRLLTFAQTQINLCLAQLGSLQKLQGPTNNLISVGREVAQDLDLTILADQSLSNEVLAGWRNQLMDGGASAAEADELTSNLTENGSVMLNRLRRQMYASPFSAASYYDDLAYECLRSLAGARLAVICASTQTGPSSSNLSSLSSELLATQAALLEAMSDTSKLTAAVQALREFVAGPVANANVTDSDPVTAIKIGETIREALRTVAAGELALWCAGWKEPASGANLLASAASRQSLEVDDPDVPANVSTVDDLLSSPPADGSTVTVLGKFGPMSSKEGPRHATSWTQLSSLTTGNSLGIVERFAKLDTSGQGDGVTAIVSGVFASNNPLVSGPAIQIGRVRIRPAARGWRTQLNVIYKPRLHSESVWWSWDAGPKVWAANPLIHGMWWI